MSGYAPTSKQIEEMVDLWGEAFLRAVFVEAWERQDRYIATLITDREMAVIARRQAEERLEALRAEGKEVQEDKLALERDEHEPSGPYLPYGYNIPIETLRRELESTQAEGRWRRAARLFRRLFLPVAA
ncbi:hypothetical protein EI613_26995 [Azospirillum sp. 412522]|nr:hypothetical protein [Azospirillum sp. 412522]MBY6265539.1 hypothetical protein [Azospirillum sp. 412522]